MIRKEAIAILTEYRKKLINSVSNQLDKDIEAFTMAIQALEQEPKTGQFAEWVAREIFDENWEYNKDAFAELACRKLAKLGIVRAKGNEWELVDPQENCDTCKHKEESWDSEHCEGCCGNHSGFEPQESDHKCHTCKHYTSGEHDGSCGSYICKEYSNWESEDKE